MIWVPCGSWAGARDDCPMTTVQRAELDQSWARCISVSETVGLLCQHDIVEMVDPASASAPQVAQEVRARSESRYSMRTQLPKPTGLRQAGGAPGLSMSDAPTSASVRHVVTMSGIT